MPKIGYFIVVNTKLYTVQYDPGVDSLQNVKMPPIDKRKNSVRTIIVHILYSTRTWYLGGL